MVANGKVDFRLWSGVAHLLQELRGFVEFILQIPLPGGVFAEPAQGITIADVAKKVNVRWVVVPDKLQRRPDSGLVFIRKVRVRKCNV